MPIDRFYDPRSGHTVLSNFYEGNGFDAPHFDGGEVVHWPSAEHYYQAAKARSFDEAEKIRFCETPGIAKKAGRNLKIRLGWDSFKLDVMRLALGYKFAPDTPEAAYLKSTERFVLSEGNYWNDRFWGVCKGTGSNWLGWLLMAQRSWLIAEEFDN